MRCNSVQGGQFEAALQCYAQVQFAELELHRNQSVSRGQKRRATQKCGLQLCSRLQWATTCVASRSVRLVCQRLGDWESCRFYSRLTP